MGHTSPKIIVTSTCILSLLQIACLYQECYFLDSCIPGRRGIISCTVLIKNINISTDVYGVIGITTQEEICKPKKRRGRGREEIIWDECEQEVEGRGKDETMRDRREQQAAGGGWHDLLVMVTGPLTCCCLTLNCLNVIIIPGPISNPLLQYLVVFTLANPLFAFLIPCFWAHFAFG